MASSAKRGKIGGQGGIFSRAIWVFICCCIVLAIYKGLGGSPGAVFSASEDKGKELEKALKDEKNPLKGFERWIKEQAPKPKDGAGVNSGSGGSSGGSVDVGSASAKTNFDYGKLKSEARNFYPVVNNKTVAYNRKQWRHWDNVGTCWTVREQVLYRDAVSGSAKLLDANKKPTNDVKKACEIVGGKWVDRYTGKTFTNPKDLDIDHMVPLRNAALSGGQAWPETAPKGTKGTPVKPNKELYANYLGNPYHLVAVSASENRAKGDKGPEVWMPPNKAFHKEYVAAWFSVKKEFGLSMNTQEKDKVVQVLAQ